MEDILRAVVEVAGGLAFLWTAWQERRHHKAKKAPTLADALKSGPYKAGPVKRKK